MVEDTRYEHALKVVARRIAGEVLLVPIVCGIGDLGSIYLMNETALFLWERIDGRATERDLVSAMADEFAVSPEEASQDARVLLEELRDAGLIRAAA